MDPVNQSISTATEVQQPDEPDVPQPQKVSSSSDSDLETESSSSESDTSNSETDTSSSSESDTCNSETDTSSSSESDTSSSETDSSSGPDSTQTDDISDSEADISSTDDQSHPPDSDISAGSEPDTAAIHLPQRSSALARTVNPSLESFDVPEPVEESSIGEEEPEASVHVGDEETYELVAKSSQRMKDKLVDSLGYSYNVSRRRGTTVCWQCTVRNKVHKCKATVIERMGLFTARMHPHIHMANPGTAEESCLRSLSLSSCHC